MTELMATNLEESPKVAKTQKEKTFEWEQKFMHFCQQYKDEIQECKKNSKRFCDKIQELQVTVLEQSIPLEKAHKLIFEKDKEIAGYKEQHKALLEKYSALQKDYKALELQYSQNEVDYSAYIDELNDNLYEVEKSCKNLIKQQNEEISKLEKMRDELLEQLSNQEDVSQLQAQLENTTKDHEKYIEQLQKSFSDEKFLLEAKYEKQLKDLKIELQEYKDMKNREVNNLEKSNDDLIGMKESFRKNCADLKKEVAAQQKEIAELQQKLDNSNQEHLLKVEELQVYFEEQNNKMETKYKKQIEEIKQLKEKEFKAKNSLIKDLEEQNDLLVQQSNDVINQQTRDISSLQEEVQDLNKNIQQIEDEKKRLVEEHNYKINTIGRVFNNPVSVPPPIRQPCYTIQKTKVQPQQRSAPIHKFFSTKNVTTSKLTIRKRPSMPPPAEKEEVVSTTNSSAELNKTVIPSRPRAAKRNIDYTSLLQSDVEDNIEPEAVPEPPLKLTRTESSSRSSRSDMRFAASKPTSDVYEFEQEVAETSEDDPFDRLKEII